jgi:ATP-dependent RNA helicase DDX21
LNVRKICQTSSRPHKKPIMARINLDSDADESSSDVVPEEAPPAKSSPRTSTSTTTTTTKRPNHHDTSTNVDTKRTKTASQEPGNRPRTRSMDTHQTTPKNSQPVSDFEMNDKTVKVLATRGITSLFEIQCLTYKPILEGKDVVGRARTGQGKTLAYCLPVIEVLFRRKHDFNKRARLPAVLVMAPTRELAMQVSNELQLTAPHIKVCSVYGGSSYDPQLRALKDGLDAVVGTPGRICDLLEKGALKLKEVQFLILDEADQMLDMGFQDEMQRVFDACPSSSTTSPMQTLLFSATLPSWVQSVTSKRMRAPVVKIDLVGEGDVQASTDVDHMSLMAPVKMEQRAKLINDLLVVYGNLAGDGRAIVFCATKKQCDELATSDALHVEVKAMHGDVMQAARERVLAAFRRGQIKVLVATDVAARGLDIKGVDLVINNGPPATNLSKRADPESYVHRSGRTGRAGRKGNCITLFGPYDQSMIADIERSTGNTLRRIPAPQPQDLMQSAARAACEAAEAVDAKVAKHFDKPAKELIAKLGGGERAVQACLARLTGFDTAAAVRPRSLLQSAEGWVTVRFAPQSGKPMHSKGMVFTALRQVLPAGAADATRGMVLTEDGDAAYFDLECQYEEALREAVEGSEFSFPTELPKKFKAGGEMQQQHYGGGRGGYSHQQQRGRGGSWGRGGGRR